MWGSACSPGLMDRWSVLVTVYSAGSIQQSSALGTVASLTGRLDQKRNVTPSNFLSYSHVVWLNPQFHWAHLSRPAWTALFLFLPPSHWECFRSGVSHLTCSDCIYCIILPMFFFFFFSVITIKIVCLVLIFLTLMWYGSKVHPGTFPLKLTRCTNFLSATSHSVQLRTVACLLPSKLDSVERRALQPVLQLWRGAHRPGGIWGLASLLTLAHGKPTFRRYSGCTSGVLSAVKANAKLVVSKVASKSLQNIEWLLQYYN